MNPKSSIIHHPASVSTAYLDIETTGLSSRHADLTVVGVGRVEDGRCHVQQLVGDAITADRLLAALEGVDTLYTYNGSRFDLPFIQAKLRPDLFRHTRHVDLMYACWRHKLKGGLKSVERQLGIERQRPDINGYMAVQLWWDYINNCRKESLDLLLAYNREDVANLHILRQRLAARDPC